MLAAMPHIRFALSRWVLGVGALAAQAPAWAQDNGQHYPCTGTAAVSPRVLCVRAGAGAGGNGSASAPFGSIQAAVDAGVDGDIIEVAGGSYAENVRLGTFAQPASRDLRLLGGFAADFSARDAAAWPARISGGAAAPTVQLHVDSAGSSVLDGFVISGGRGLGSDWTDGNGDGGGVYVYRLGNGSTVVSHNEITANQTVAWQTSNTRGGGIHAFTQDWGGATAQVLIEDNHVHGNRAGKGGGINVGGRAALLRGNRIEDNEGHSDHGGGVYVATHDVEVSGNVIRGNVIGVSAGYGWGGGIIIDSGHAELHGNLVTGNVAPLPGSGVFWDEGANGTMRNDLVVANGCPQDGRSGAALYIDGGAAPSVVTIENVTIADHDCPAMGAGTGVILLDGGSSATFRNSILWHNTREFATVNGGSYGISHSLTQQPGSGNRWQDPLFADAAHGDYHLRSAGGRWTSGGWVVDAQTSPAIDAGDPASPWTLEPEPNGGRVNLGAYGNTVQASRSPSELIFRDGFDAPARARVAAAD